MSIWSDHLLLAATSLGSLFCVYLLSGAAAAALLDRFSAAGPLSRPDRICRALILGFIPASLITRTLLAFPEGIMRFGPAAAVATAAVSLLYLLRNGKTQPPPSADSTGVSAAALSCWIFLSVLAAYLGSRWLSAPKVFDVMQMWVYQGYLQGADIVDSPGPDPGLLLRFGWHYGALLLSGAYFNHSIFPLLNSGSFVFIPAAFLFIWSAATMIRHVFPHNRGAAAAALFVFSLLFISGPTHEYMMMNKGPVLSLSLFFASLGWFIRYQEDRKLQPLILCGLSMGLTSDTGLTGLFFGGLYYALAFIFSRDKNALFQAAAWALLCLALCVLPLRVSIGAMEATALILSLAAACTALLLLRYACYLDKQCASLTRFLCGRSRILAPLSLLLPLCAMTVFAYPETPWHGGHFSWYAFGFWGVYFHGYALLFVCACLFMVLALFLKPMRAEAELLSPFLILCFVLPALTYLSAMQAVWDLAPEILQQSVLRALSRYWPPTILDLSRSLHLYFVPLSFSLCTAVLLPRLCLISRRPALPFIAVLLTVIWIWGLGHDPVSPPTVQHTGKHGWNPLRHSSVLERSRHALDRIRLSAVLLSQLRQQKDYRPLLLWDNLDQIRLLRFLAPRYLYRDAGVYFDLPAPNGTPEADPQAMAFHAWRIHNQVIGPRYAIFSCSELPDRLPAELYIVTLNGSAPSTACPAISCSKDRSPEKTWRVGPYTVRLYRCPGQAHQAASEKPSRGGDIAANRQSSLRL